MSSTNPYTKPTHKWLSKLNVYKITPKKHTKAWTLSKWKNIISSVFPIGATPWHNVDPIAVIPFWIKKISHIYSAVNTKRTEIWKLKIFFHSFMFCLIFVCEWYQHLTYKFGFLYAIIVANVLVCIRVSTLFCFIIFEHYWYSDSSFVLNRLYIVLEPLLVGIYWNSLLAFNGV